MAWLVLVAVSAVKLTVVEQTLHTRHRPPPGQRHLEVPERVIAAGEHLRDANLPIEWRRGVDGLHSPEDAVVALKRVHTIEHLRTVQTMSQTGGGFDTDTYWCVASLRSDAARI